MSKVRWGILGVAKINERLLPAFAQVGNAELRAIASRSMDKARQAAAAAGIPTAHGSYQALLDDRNIDAVYIPLPNSMHGEWTKKAAERGKHVLCEKPLAPTADEAQELVDFCKANGVYLLEGFMWPHHHRTARLRQFLDGGGIGEIRRVVGAFTFCLDKLDPGNIRLQPDLGGGSLLDVGCYPVYAIRWAFKAEPVRVYAAAQYANGVDVQTAGMLWFAGDRTAAFDCAFTLPYRTWVEIIGTEGTVRVSNLWVPLGRAAFEVQRPNQPIEEIVVAGEDQIVRMLENFGQAVLDKRPVQPSAEEAVKTLRVLDALAKSARQGKEVAI